jgi:sec-independent protein translocase protein TatB
MFDIGFTEILLVGVVSLVVLGPEKLPGAVRTAALMIGRLKRSFNTLKAEIEKEVGADEIRRQLRNEDIMERFKQTQTVLNDTINSVKEGTEEFRKNIELESQSASWSSHGGEPAETPAISPLPETTPGESAVATTAYDTETATANIEAAATPVPAVPVAAAPHTDAASNEKSAS